MIGTTVGRYTITARLAVGSSGETWLALDASLNRTVALTILTSSSSSFLEDMRRLGAIDHPNIASVHEAGALSDGRPWLAVSWNGGLSLREKMEAGPIPLYEGLSIAAQAGRGLQKAHEAGLAHGYLAPESLVVGDDGQVRIVDFAVAEHAPGESLDTGSDIQALGAVLREMLGAGIPPGVDQIIAKALQRETSHHYTCMAEMVRELEQAQTGLSHGTLARRVVQRVLRPWRRRSVLAWGTLAAVVIAAGTGAFFLWTPAAKSAAYTASLGYLPASARVTIALLPISGTPGLNADDALGQVMTDELMTDLVRIRGLRVISQDSARRVKADEPVARVGERLGVDYVLKASTARRGEEVLLSLELWLTGTTTPRLWVEPGAWLLRDGREGGQRYTKEFTAPAADVNAMLEKVAEEAAQNAAVRVTAADRERIRGKADIKPEAKEAYARGRTLADAAGNPDSIKAAIRFLLQAVATEPAYAAAWAALGMTLSQAGPGSAVSGVVVTADEALRRALALEPASADVQFALGQANGNLHRYAEAKKALEAALTADPNHAQAHSSYAVLLARYGRLDEALAEAKEGVRLDPLSPAARHSLSLQYIWSRRYTEGIPVILDALAMDPDDPLTLMYNGWILAEAGRYEEGIQSLERAVKLGVPSGEAYLGYVLARKGDVPQACAIADALADAWRSGDAAGAQLVAMIRANTGETQLALEWLRKAQSAGGPGFLGGLDVEPSWDPLRALPEFREMVRMPEWYVPAPVASGQQRTENGSTQSRPVVFMTNSGSNAPDDFLKRVHDYVVQQTGVEFTYRSFPDDYEAQRDAAIAAHAQIDVFSTGTQEMWRNRARGVIRDITDAVNVYGPDMKKLFADAPGWDVKGGALWWPSTIDGRIWAIPSATWRDYGIFLAIRRDWREKLGMAPIETIDQFEAYLRKVKVTDLNGNGKADEVPFDPIYGDQGLLGIAYSMTYPFIGATGWHHEWDQSIYLDTRGRITPTVMHPDFRTFLARMAAWYKDGLFYPELTTSTLDQTMDRLAANQVGAISDWFCEFWDAWHALVQKVPDAEYEFVVLNGPGGSPGRLPVNPPSGPAWTYTAWAPRDVVNAGIKLQNWFAASKDNYQVQTHGVQQADWRYVDRRTNADRPIVAQISNELFSFHSFLAYGPWDSIPGGTDDWFLTKLREASLSLYKQQVSYYPDWFVPYDFKGTPVEANNKKASDFINAAIADIIMNKAPLEGWDAKVAEYRAMWADQFIKSATAQYNKALRKR